MYMESFFERSMLVFVLLIVVGCSTVTETSHVTENPDAEEILSLDPEASILQFDGIVYQTGIDWVEDLSFTKDEQVGEIKKQNDTDTNFEDEMANKLPVGAKIYSVKEEGKVAGPILLVEAEGKQFKFLGFVEG